MKRYLILAILFFSFSIYTNAKTYTDTLKVGYTNASPFIINQDSELSGINIWLWETIAHELGLKYELVPMGFKEMLLALEDGSIDVSINPLTITSKRTAIFNFTSPYYVSNATVVVKKPSTFRQLLDVVTGLFSLDFIRGLLFLFIIILSFGVLGWYFEKGKNPDFRNNSKGIWDGLWWSVVTITTVGYGDKSPKTRFGKITALVLMFVGLLFISGLTASIASSLTVNQIGASQNDYTAFKDKRVGTVDNTSVQTFLKQNFFKKIVGFPNVTDGIKALNEQSVDAFIYDEPILKYRIKKNHDDSNIQVLPIKFDVQFYAFGLSKQQHDLQHSLSEEILKVIETKEWEVLLNEYGLKEI